MEICVFLLALFYDYSMKITDKELLEQTLEIFPIIVNVITNRAEPCEDNVIATIVSDVKHEMFRDYHPVALFTSIRFIDELAQLITEKRVAEMNPEEAWKWEMNRVANLIYETACQGYPSRNPLVKGMTNRIIIILNDERKKYETE
jgi:hypothetical protein